MLLLIILAYTLLQRLNNEQEEMINIIHKHATIKINCFKKEQDQFIEKFNYMKKNSKGGGIYCNWIDYSLLANATIDNVVSRFSVASIENLCEHYAIKKENDNKLFLFINTKTEIDYEMNKEFKEMFLKYDKYCKDEQLQLIIEGDNNIYLDVLLYDLGVWNARINVLKTEKIFLN